MSQLQQSPYSLRLIISLALLLSASGSICGQISQYASAAKISGAAAPKSPNAQSKSAADKVIDDVKPTAKGTSETTATSERLSALENALSAQGEKIEKMNQLIAEQQRMIQQLLGKSNAANTTNTANTAAQSEPLITSIAPSTASADNTVAAANTAGNSQTQTIDQQVKKIQDQVLKIGAIRLSGDFRLRLDGTFRRSDPTPPAGFAALPLVQNIHPTYRLRLNLDTDVSKTVSFHGQLATGPVNDPLSTEQDFSGITVRQPFFINEAWIDYHPTKSLQFQAGRVQEIFTDNSRFVFDDDVRFNGFNEKYVAAFKNKPAGFTSIEFRAGQYFFSNPNLAIITAGSPLAQAGAPVGSIARTSDLYHQGILANQKLSKKFDQQFGGDLQIYRNPNEIQLASTATGVAFVVYPGLGLTLSGPLTGTGNATTTAGGAIYAARNFEITRFTYRLNYAGFKAGSRTYPVTFNFQAARNVGTSGKERDAYLAALQIGKVAGRNDMAFTYVFSMKGANALISQLTDNNLGTGTGVNIRANHFRFDYGLSKRVTFQSLFFIQNELRNSGDFPNFFVPVNAFTPRLYRFQEQMLFTF